MNFNDSWFFLEEIRLTRASGPDKLKFVSRLIFAASIAVAFAGPLRAQSRVVPGRDLLEFPLGALAEAQPLATQFGAGFWNPATMMIDGPDRGRLAAAAL